MTRDIVKRVDEGIGPHVDPLPTGRKGPWEHDKHPWNRRAGEQAAKANARREKHGKRK